MSGPAQVEIIHLSDLHLPLSGSAPLSSLLGKRFLGWLNLKMLRSNTHQLEAFRALLGRVAGLQADAVVISGDLVNLAYDFEFAQVADLLAEAGLEPARCMLVPGNHDRYTRRADKDRAFERGMAAWLPEDLTGEEVYPWVKDLGPVRLIGLDTAVWRGPLRAAGCIREAQLARLAEILDDMGEGRHPVLVMHHPPFRLRGPFFRDYRAGLSGMDALLKLLAQRMTTVLHGHLHSLGRRREGSVEILGAPSASNVCGRKEDQIACHRLRFDGHGLLQARSLRLWPKEDGGWREEEEDLPGEALLR